MEVWHRRQLGEVATLSGRIGWRGLTAKEYKHEGPWFLSVHSLNHGDYVDFREAFHISQERYDESPEIMLRRGDVLICKDGAGIGKMGIVGELPGPATINSSLLLIRAGEHLRPKFLYHCLCSPYFQRIVQSRLNGATTPHLYQRDITEFPVVIPPIVDQNRIVAILDEAFEGIAAAKANTEKNLQNARELFDAVQRELLADAARRSEMRELQSLCAVFFDSAHRTPKYQAEGIPALRPRDVVNGVLTLSASARVSEQEYEVQSKRYKPRSGDIVYSRELSYGWAAIIPPSTTVCLSQGMCIFRPVDGTSPRFLWRILNGPLGRDQAHQAAVGTAHPHINLGEIKAYRIPYLPDEQQRSLVDSLDEIESEVKSLESLGRRKLARLDELKQSLLHRAFSGALTTKAAHKQLATAA